MYAAIFPRDSVLDPENDIYFSGNQVVVDFQSLYTRQDIVVSIRYLQKLTLAHVKNIG
jgi:hypothetical protein